MRKLFLMTSVVLVTVIFITGCGNKSNDEGDDTNIENGTFCFWAKEEYRGQDSPAEVTVQLTLNGDDVSGTFSCTKKAVEVKYKPDELDCFDNVLLIGKRNGDTLHLTASHVDSSTGKTITEETRWSLHKNLVLQKTYNTDSYTFPLTLKVYKRTECK